MDSKKKFGILAVLLIIGIAIVVFTIRPWMQNRTVSVIVNETIDRPDLDFSFEFKSGEGAYSYIEPAMNESPVTRDLEAAFMMLDNTAYIAFQDPSFVGETPPSMSIFVFRKPSVSSSTQATNAEDMSRLDELRGWAEENAGLTSFSDARSTPEEVKIDGVTALHYKADGLYLQDIYIAFNHGRYYLIVGQYNAETDTIYIDFQDLVRSISFY